MCSSSFDSPKEILDPVRYVKKANEERNRIGRSIKDTFVPSTPKLPKTLEVAGRKPLAIGTQTGGTARRPLGSASGINT